MINYLLTPLKLYRRRHKTLASHPLLRLHLSMLESLGPDAMSDDESDREDAVQLNGDYRKDQSLPSFDVVVPIWRSSLVTEWLISIDVLYVKLMRSSDKLRGCFPHIRRRNYHSVNKEAKCVKGLPVNAYDTEWHQQLIQKVSGGCSTKKHRRNQEKPGTWEPMPFSPETRPDLQLRKPREPTET